MFIANTTQEHLDIEDIKNNMVILKSGSVCAVLEATAVNFDLLSEIEQDAIIASFSMLLNSITFPIQVVIRSKRLDITKYLDSIKRVEAKITDPLFKMQAQAYRQFIQETIENNEVLDKKFYVVIPNYSNAISLPSSSAFGWLNQLTGKQNKRIKVDIQESLAKAESDLKPKIDHVMGEFNRLNVKVKQLTTQQLVELYFDIYNPSSISGQKIITNVDDYKTPLVNPAILEE